MQLKGSLSVSFAVHIYRSVRLSLYSITDEGLTEHCSKKKWGFSDAVNGIVSQGLCREEHVKRTQISPSAQENEILLPVVKFSGYGALTVPEIPYRPEENDYKNADSFLSKTTAFSDPHLSGSLLCTISYAACFIIFLRLIISVTVMEAQTTLAVGFFLY